MLRYFVLVCLLISTAFFWKNTTKKFLSSTTTSKMEQYYQESFVFSQYQKSLASLRHAFQSLLESYFVYKDLGNEIFLPSIEERTTQIQSIVNFHNQIRILRSQIPISVPISVPLIESSLFGARLDPLIHKMVFHTGIDLQAREKESVYAVADGEISIPDKNKSYGINVVIVHQYGFVTLYGHLQSVSKNILPGMQVKRGEKIGYIGHTGRAKGSHLHYEIRLNQLYLDPQPFLEFGKNLYSE